MCGLAGFIVLKNKFNSPETLLKSMTDQMSHRGPDDSGIWFSEEYGVGLGHRRLAIVDLSPLGHQPMLSPSSRYMMVYNGEIYNHLELRSELEAKGYKFRGHSDTESILACFEEYGVTKATQKFNGMFAIALWDNKDKKLFLIRDRMGIKPLYYGAVQGNFVFSSELKPLKKIPDFNNQIDRNALTTYFRYNCIPAPYTIYTDIFKLNPGEIIEFDLVTKKIVKKSRYWSAIDQVKKIQDNPWTGSYEEAKDTLEDLLKSSVKYRMLSDVPLGALLSGGIDSSLIVALMQSQSNDPIKTFTIGFSEQGYNEAGHAKKVAEHLGTSHTEMYVSPQDALNVIPNLPKIYDEPFSDSSQIPTFLVSQLTREHVTVCLSGDGGDELFGGYNRHQYVPRIWNSVGQFPPIFRRIIKKILRAVPTHLWNNAFYIINRFMPANKKFSRVGDNLLKLADILESSSQEDIYKILCSHWKNPEDLVPGAIEPSTEINLIYQQDISGSIQNRMMAVDAVTYLPNDILTKVDRASMAVSLEARVPLLDHRVFEFAWSLPLDMKISHGNGKRILKDILYTHVPKKLIDRPKAGFGIPLDTWLRTNLREWAGDLLSADSLNSHGLLNAELIHKVWEGHMSGTKNNQAELWNVLMFQSWYSENL